MVKNGKEVFRHGEAVGLGMLCELRIAGKNNLAKKLSLALEKFDLPSKIEVESSQLKKNIQNKIYNNVFLDKKK